MTDAAVPQGLHRVGTVRSTLTARENAPRQADEGAPPAVISIEAEHRRACAGIARGDRLVVITWLHLGDRSCEHTHPSGDPSRPAVGVFATRSPDRPNPIGLHTVTVTAITVSEISVDALEAVDGTPVLDIKPHLEPADRR